MKKPRLSVIIPTHKRSKILKKCIDRLEAQTIADDIEVIVVSDGHDPETAALFGGNPKSTFQIPTQFFAIEKSQQGVARNEGVKHANADRVLFIGDDIFLAPDCCERHMQIHDKQLLSAGYAVLGFTTWDPAVGITPLMKWLESSGWQFGYPMIARYAHHFLPADIQHKFTYTSNISLPTSIAREHPFLSEIHLYGWEDIEWGHRKREAGVRLYYEPDAKALHHHHITLEDSLKRMEILGKSIRHVEEIAPHVDRKPKGFKLSLQKLQALLPTMAGKHRKAFLRGLHST